MSSSPDATLKKKKKKTVAFTEDPLGADADPTTPAPDSIDDTTLKGVPVDLGPKTAHELMTEGQKGAEDEADYKSMFGDLKKKKKSKKDLIVDEADGEGSGRSTPVLAETPAGVLGGGGNEKQMEDEAEYKALFGDLKKKKKKKELPLDLVCLFRSRSRFSYLSPNFLQDQADSGTSTPVTTTAPAIATEDLDFSDIRKKKKSTKKKSAFDLEAFEKELATTTTGDEDVPDGSHLEHLDEAELGDDPFAEPSAAPSGAEANSAEPWLGSDRDYLYPELLQRFYALLHHANPSLMNNAPSKRYTIAPPQIVREGNKKSIFANVTE